SLNTMGPRANVSSTSNRSATFTRPVICFFTAANPLIGSIASVTRYEQGSAVNDMMRSTSSAENASQNSVTSFMLARSAGVGSTAAATDADWTIPARPAPANCQKASPRSCVYLFKQGDLLTTTSERSEGP